METIVTRIIPHFTHSNAEWLKHIDKQEIAETEAPNFTFEKSEPPIWKYQYISMQQQIQSTELFPAPFCEVR